MYPRLFRYVKNKLPKISDTEMIALKSGSVSIDEMAALVKARTDDRKQAIEEKFAEFEANATTQDEIDRAEENKRSYLQHLRNAYPTYVKSRL